MRRGQSRRDELVADAPGKWQVREGPVHMAELPATEPKFNPAEAVIVHRDAIPPANGGADCFNGRAGRQPLCVIVWQVN